MEELKKHLDSLETEIKQSAAKLNIAERQTELAGLQVEIAKNDWSDNLRAQDIRKKEASLFGQISPWTDLLDDVKGVLELAKLNDNSLLPELQAQTKKIEKKYEQLKKQLRFTGPYDDREVILGIYAGAGGTDAQDWAQMLQRMYLRWAETQGLKAEIIDQSAGEEAGIKSATIKLSGGSFLYGRLAGEHGVHRLVRLSPFNADNLRQTSFAKVEVLPLVDKPGEVELDEKDLRIDVFRSGGKGGQSVNTTDSAVRITHLPSGISVSVQNERSQLQNRETALGILRSRLAALQLEQHAESLAQIKGPNQSAEWGNQIRNYVLHPYKQVKDNRTGYESSDVEKVLDGNLDPLITAWLEHKPN